MHRAKTPRLFGGGRIGVCIFVATLALAGAAGPAYSQNEIERLDRLEEQLRQSRDRQQQLGEEAERLVQELEKLHTGMITAAAEVLRLEGRATVIEAKVAGLRAKEAVKAETIQGQNQDLSAVLASLARISRQPPEMLIAGQGVAINVVRSSILLASVVPLLAARADTLNADLRAVRSLRDAITQQQLELVLAANQLEKQRETLAQMLERNVMQKQRTDGERDVERQRIENLAAQAGDLGELIARLNTKKNAGLGLSPAEPRSFAQARGQVPLPVEGQVILRFGALDDFGAPARGITVESRQNAQVVAPYDGQIVFSGPFRSYGQLLIIAHGEGYHTLLAGLSRMDRRVGQWLLSGEPVGVAGGGENGRSRIYVELRRDGEPINPAPWFADRQRDP